MNRRSFLAPSSAVPADPISSHGGPARASRRSADKARSHDALRIEHCKLEIAHMDFGFMQLMKYVG
jgi:hypothetical protein